MKYQELKRRLVVEGGIVGGSLLVIAIMAFFLDSFSEDYQKSSDELEAKTQGIITTTNTLSNKFYNVQQHSELFKKILQIQSRDGFTISPQAARVRFDHLRDQYYLSDLKLSMSPIIGIENPDYKRKTNAVVASEVSLNFGALSDEYVYSLLNAIQQDMPGSSKIVSLSLTRQGDVTSEALRSISERGSAQLVLCEVKFMWLGLKPTETGDVANAPRKP